jgi:hypothetical protein
MATDRYPKEKKKVRPGNLMPFMEPNNLFRYSKDYFRMVDGDGAGDLRGEFARFRPANTCPPIKYPRPKPELKAKLAKVVISQVTRLLTHTEW